MIESLIDRYTECIRQCQEIYHFAVTFQEKGANHISMEITSKPKIWGTTLDYGKNFDNVETILAYLNLLYKQI